MDYAVNGKPDFAFSSILTFPFRSLSGIIQGPPRMPGETCAYAPDGRKG